MNIVTRMKVIFHVFVLFGFLFLYVCADFEQVQRFSETIKTKPGRKVEMKCFNRNKDDKLHWFYKKDNASKQDEPLRMNVDKQRESNGNEEILVLKRPIYSDEGIYILKPFGNDGKTVCRKYLEILSAPIAICKASLSMPIDRGSDVTLECKASRGNPTPLVTWYRLGHHGIKQTHLVDTSTITIREATEYASGSYECHLQNEIGNDTCSVNVTVKFGPEIELYETKIELTEVKNTTLMCRVTANPMAHVMWTRDQSVDQLYTNEKYDIKEDQELIDTHFTKYLILTLNAKGLRANMFGVYWCRLAGYGVSYARKVEVVRITDGT